MAKQHDFRLTLRKAEPSGDTGIAVVFGGPATVYVNQRFIGTLDAAKAKLRELGNTETRQCAGMIGMAQAHDRKPAGFSATKWVYFGFDPIPGYDCEPKKD